MPIAPTRDSGETRARAGRRLALADALADALRPLVAEIVKQEIERRLAELERDRGDEIEYLTTAEYAVRFKTTPEAVGARIRRKTLPAIKPPGSREWVIPVAEGEGYPEGSDKPRRRWNGPGRDTGERTSDAE